MQNIFTISGTNARSLLEEAEGASTALLFVPGTSAGAFSDRFQPLMNAAHAAGMSLMRMQSWENAQELEKKTIAEVQSEIDVALKHLQEKGYKYIVGVGKSFGGAMMLINQNSLLAAKVLWSPAISFNEAKDTLGENMNKLLSDIPSIKDVQVDPEFLSQIMVPVCLIHGTEDDIVPSENSRRMAGALPIGVFVEVNGADHSWRIAEHEKQLIEETIKFAQSVS